MSDFDPDKQIGQLNDVCWQLVLTRPYSILEFVTINIDIGPQGRKFNFRPAHATKLLSNRYLRTANIISIIFRDYLAVRNSSIILL
jgi:hypothetical protein